MTLVFFNRFRISSVGLSDLPSSQKIPKARLEREFRQMRKAANKKIRKTKKRNMIVGFTSQKGDSCGMFFVALKAIP